MFINLDIVWRRRRWRSTMASDTATKAFLVLIYIVAIGAANSPSKRGQGYQITPKACQVNKVKGICMFVWECIRHDGEHLGMCMDSFMFGSCCLLPDNVTVPTVASDVNAAASSAVSTYISQQTNRPPPSHSNSIYGRPSTKRPYLNRYSSTTSSPSTSKYSTTTSLPLSSTVQKNPFLTTRPPLTSLSSPSTNKYPTTEVSKYPSISDNSVTQSKQPPPEKTTSMWVSSTEPAFITRPKPTVFWSTSIRPRPPDFIPGSINGQRPTRPPKPTPVGSFITKKPTRPSPSQFITSTTVKIPIKPTTPEMKPISIDFITATTKRPTVSPPALLDFVTLSTKKPATIMLMAKPTVSTTTVSLPNITTSTSTTTLAPLTGQSSTVTLTSVHVPTPKPIKNRKECGVPPLFPRPEMRIVGGNSAPFGGWPWQVSVRRTSFFGFSSTHRCGGAVLNENWIATAGHCVDDLLTSQIRIRVGEYDFSSAGEPLAHEERGVSRKVVHPRYNFFTYEYDLALVQLDRPLEFAPHVAPICLPGSDDLLVGETATVTGWGRLSEGGTLPSVLQEVSVPIVSNENCKSMFLRAGRHEHIPDIFLCAGYEDGGRDSCQGDSGGPLQVRGKDGRYFLAGIISWGIGCAESNLPGVCTRISKFVDWIMENVS